LPFAAAVSAQTPNANEFVSSLRWPGAPPAVILTLGCFFVAVAGFLVFYQWNRRRKAVKDIRDHSIGLFDEQCRNRRLTDEEKEILVEMLPYLPNNAQPHEVFESILIYEHCLNAYINKRLAEIRTRERMEDDGEVLRFLRKKMGYDMLSHEHALASTRNISAGQPTSVITTGQHAVLAQNTKIISVGEFYFTVRVADELQGRKYAAGDELTVAFVRSGDAAYSVNARVMGVNDSGGIMLYHTLKFSRSQKRQFMRLEVNAVLKFRVVEKAGKDKDGEAKKPTAQVYTGRVVDISGGGLSFFIDNDERLEAGDVISVTLMLPGEPLTGIKSKVVVVTPVEGKTATHYRHHIRYEAIEPQQRERIVKYVFIKHRQMLQMR
jgi:c-di-GMP-binding flagellar brake protein YcgR